MEERSVKEIIITLRGEASSIAGIKGDYEDGRSERGRLALLGICCTREGYGQPHYTLPVPLGSTHHTQLDIGS